MKTKITTIWTLTITFIICAIAGMLYYGYTVGAIFLVVLCLSAVHFILVHVIDKPDWNNHDYMAYRNHVTSDFFNHELCESEHSDSKWSRITTEELKERRALLDIREEKGFFALTHEECKRLDELTEKLKSTYKSKKS